MKPRSSHVWCQVVCIRLTPFYAWSGWTSKGGHNQPHLELIKGSLLSLSWPLGLYPSIEPRTESLEASYYSCLVTPNAFFTSRFQTPSLLQPQTAMVRINCPGLITVYACELAPITSPCDNSPPPPCPPRSMTCYKAQWPCQPLGLVVTWFPSPCPILTGTRCLPPVPCPRPSGTQEEVDP